MKEFWIALAVTGTALGLEFASGRALSAFYGQTAGASVLGIAVSALTFGVLTALIAHFSQRNGAKRLARLFERLPGKALNGLGRTLHALFFAAAAYLLLSSAAHMAALMLPLQNAALYGACFALVLALWLAASRREAQRSAAAFLALLLALYALALWLFSPVMDAAQLAYALELKLEGSYAAAALLGLVHASLCVCLSAGMLLRLCDGRTRAPLIGLWSAAQLAALIYLGNAALLRQPQRLLALRYPFAALSAQWGSGGFYFCGMLTLLGSIIALSGLLSALMPRKGMLNYKKTRCSD